MSQLHRAADAPTTRNLALPEDPFRLLVDSVMDYAIVMLDPEGRVATWNKGARYINGYAAEEIIDQNFAVFYPQADVREGKPQSALSLAASRGRFQDQGWRVRKDGSRFWTEVVITPIYNKEGKLSGFATISRDMSGRRKAEQTFKDLLEAAPDAIVIIGQTGTIILVNSQAERLFGYSRDELLGNSVETLMPPSLSERHAVLREAYFAAPETREMGAGLELYGLRKDGSMFPIQISLSPLETEDGTLVSAAIRDVTERKIYERALEEKNQALEAAVKDLDAFSYSVSHDLRAPLRAIAGFNRILLKEYGPCLDATAREYLESVRDNAIQMGQLVDDLLAFSRLGRRSIAKQDISVAAIVEQVLREVRPRYEGRNIEVTVSELPRVQGDPALLKQVFINLIDNAIKYTRMREEAVIEIGSSEADGERVFFVKDNGAGFDMQYADKLFGVFQRLHRQEDFEGTGVGLAIVQRVIMRHGGRIWADAAVDKGATFYFTLEAHDGA